MYDEGLYDIDDKAGLRCEASIRPGAYLYRVSSLSHCRPQDVLSGQGSVKCRDDGRFHIQQQTVSYCANNVLTAFGEVLFHMYKLALKRLGERQNAQAVRDAVVSRRSLSAFRVDGIPDLIYIDAEGLQVDFDPRIRGAAVVYPEATYDLFLELNRSIRKRNKRGIVYPSARHSRGYCFALFDDETSHIDVVSFRNIEVKLMLVSEQQQFGAVASPCNPFREKLHCTMGYYEFVDQIVFDKARTDGILNPAALPGHGLVDFVRRRYDDYPRQAICPH